MTDLTPATHPTPSVSRATAEQGLTDFEVLLRTALVNVGLPDDGIFVPVKERARMLGNLGDAIDDLDSKTLSQSFYVSKMVAAASAGLFDAALNYLWDELVSTLRAKVANFDLEYFFDVVAGANTDLRGSLKGEDDLKSVTDAKLLNATLSIGLITDVGFNQLDHIRYMRNNASAAHPNQIALTGLQLANFLQICVKEVINTPLDTVTADTGRLLANIKKKQLDNLEIESAATFFNNLPYDRVEPLAKGLFGLYTASKRTPIIADNVRRLWVKLWPFIPEGTRQTFGLRHAKAVAMADGDTAQSARDLLDIVKGGSYLSPSIRAVEISDALDALSSAHAGWGNFAEEPKHARKLASLIGEQGDVPMESINQYVSVVVDCFLGNHYGVSNAALPTYEGLIEKFSPEMAGIALREAFSMETSVLLGQEKPARQWKRLLSLLDSKVFDETDRSLLDALRDFKQSPSKIRKDSNLRRLARVN